MPLTLEDLLGSGLVLGGSLLDKEPGEVAESRAFARNVFTSPTMIPERVSQLAGTGQQYFEPLIRQRRENALADISARVKSMFPATVGVQGPEIAALGKYLTEEALPSELAFYGNLGLQGFGAQQQAARDILTNAKPNPAAEAMAQLGTALLLRDRMGAGGAFGGGGGGFNLASLFGGGPSGAGGGGGILSTLQSLVGGGGGVQSRPVQLGQLTPQELAEQLARTGGVSGGGTLPGGIFGGVVGADLLSKLIPALQLAGGTALALKSPDIGTNQFQSTATGAIGGAIAGGVFGPAGTVIGSLLGGLRGFTGERAQRQAIKAQRHAEDLASQQSNVGKVGSFWVDALAGAGVPYLDEFANAVKQVTARIDDPDEIFSVPSAGISVRRSQARFGSDENTDEGELVAGIGSQLLLKEIQKTRPDITDLDLVPGFRDAYVNYLLQHIWHEGGVTPTTQTFGGLLDAASIDR